VHGFRTFTFLDEHVGNWFESWTLTYMVWWIAWAPFVGVFIARISKGRSIREFILGVILGPTLFSILWFGVFGGAGFHAVLRGGSSIMDVVRDNVSAVTFFMLESFPLPLLTISMVIVAAFLFIVTSVVSAAFVLGMFSTGGGHVFHRGRSQPQRKNQAQLGRHPGRARLRHDPVGEYGGDQIDYRTRLPALYFRGADTGCLPAENTEKRIRGADMSDAVLDTLLNITVFAFIGLLIWLYFKKVDD
jgi:hypothetical protein